MSQQCHLLSSILPPHLFYRDSLSWSLAWYLQLLECFSCLAKWQEHRTGRMEDTVTAGGLGNVASIPLPQLPALCQRDMKRDSPLGSPNHCLL